MPDGTNVSDNLQWEDSNVLRVSRKFNVDNVYNENYYVTEISEETGE